MEDRIWNVNIFNWFYNEDNGTVDDPAQVGLYLSKHMRFWYLLNYLTKNAQASHSLAIVFASSIHKTVWMLMKTQTKI